MKNINKTKLNIFLLGQKTFVILAISVISLTVSPSLTSAGVRITSCGLGGCNGVFDTETTGTFESEVPATQAPAPAATTTIYSNSTGPTTTTAAKPVVKKATTTKKATAKATTKTAAPITIEDVPSEDMSNMTANALFGEDGFLPTSLVGWTALSILILLIVILIRKVIGAEARYHAEPLKHA